MKDDFEKLKKEYKSEIENNQVITKGIAEAWDTKQIGVDFFTILDPKNERELKYAISIMYFAFDFNKFINGCTEDLFEDFKCEDHEAIKLVIDAINTLKETGDRESINPENMSMVDRAKILYGLLLIQCLGQVDETIIEYAATKTGLDPENYMEVIQFASYLNAILEVHKEAKEKMGELKYSEINDEQVDELYDYTMEFRRLLEKDTNKEITK